jgi:hypothetical protein
MSIGTYKQTNKLTNIPDTPWFCTVVFVNFLFNCALGGDIVNLITEVLFLFHSGFGLPGSEMIFPGPAKSFVSDRIRIRNTCTLPVV